MMEIDVRRIARLARLSIPEDEVEAFARQMAGMMQMVDHLPELSSAEALLEPDNTMALRADVVLPSTPREAILRNAPETADGCFLVPKTVD